MLRARRADLRRGVGGAEIDHDIATFDRGRNRIAAIRSGRDRQAGILRRPPRRRPGPFCPAHQRAAPGSRRSFQAFVPAPRASCAGALRSPCSSWSSGSRQSAAIAPRQASAVFAGTGFGSMKRSLKRAKNFRCCRRASAALPSRKSRTSCATSAGKRLEATLTTPDRADRKKGQRQRVVAAQDGEAFRQPANEFAHPVDAPARFLDRDDVRTMLRQPDDCIRSDVDSAAAGNVVEHELERGRLGDRGEMAEESFLARLVVIGRDEERAVHADFLRFLRVQRSRRGSSWSRCRRSPGSDSRATLTASSITWWRSPQLRVGDSPVVPTGTIPVMPPAICASIRRSKAANIDLVVSERGNERCVGAARTWLES